MHRRGPSYNVQKCTINEKHHQGLHLVPVRDNIKYVSSSCLLLRDGSQTHPNNQNNIVEGHAATGKKYSGKARYSRNCSRQITKFMGKGCASVILAP